MTIGLESKHFYVNTMIEKQVIIILWLLILLQYPISF